MSDNIAKSSRALMVYQSMKYVDIVGALSVWYTFA